ncbi:ABC transporter permease [Labrys sp. 22185]|uniref:ABC transporter permease n=1 Tax=Labrys sp. 22185 TaxID=3453888 RepID=UPI003F84F203
MYQADSDPIRGNQPPPEPTPAVTLIVPDRLWRFTDLYEIWRYRDLAWVLTERDIKVRYKQTVLGFAWAIIQPLLLMLIFSVLFGHLAKIPTDGSPYPIFVYAGLLPWVFFSNALTAAAGSLVGSVNLISKVYFPRLIIPLASTGAGLVDFLVTTALLLVMMLIYGVGWSINLLVAPLLMVGVILCALGVGTGLSALTATYRDFRFVVPFLLQFWMFATPVVYPASLVPEAWRWLLFLNPMAGLVEGFRSAFLGHPFDWLSIGLSLLLSLGLFVLGVWYFERVERRFADIL